MRRFVLPEPKLVITEVRIDCILNSIQQSSVEDFTRDLANRLTRYKGKGSRIMCKGREWQVLRPSLVRKPALCIS